MGYYTHELTQAENWNRPGSISLSKVAQPFQCKPVMGQSPAVSINENVGIYGNHSRPSIRSSRELLSVRSTPG